MVQFVNITKKILLNLPNDLSANKDKIHYLMEHHMSENINPSTIHIPEEHLKSSKDFYIKGYLPFENKVGDISYFISNLDIITSLEISSKSEILVLKEQDLYKILKEQFSKINNDKALYALENINHRFTAKNLPYKMISFSFLLIFTLLCIFCNNIFNIGNNLVYLIQNILRSILFIKTILHRGNKTLSLNHNIVQAQTLPIYTILVPLYQETQKIQALIQAINNLEYPRNKLDVKFIVEQDDQATIQAILSLNIPDYIHLIKVPYSLPRTKPKALNYAMNYAKGEYVTIYDAEDIPDPMQLLDAITMFNNLPEEYVCLQAKLNFYNANENILTKFFSIEYKLWFEFALKGLSLLNLPITLGGTSNHFKTQFLEQIGFWDAYNVTEDADLGVRIYLKGYKIALLDSLTLEEAPINIKIWIWQRSRWIKGFLQTLFVLIMQKKDYSKITKLQLLVTYIFIGFSSYSFLILPWLIMAYFLNSLHPYLYYLSITNGFFTLIYMYSSAYIVIMEDRYLVGNKKAVNNLCLIFWPFYFILHTVASYIAIWDMVFTPFHWRKTKHGLSNYG